MATSTPNYSFQKPTVSGDSGVWGGYLNANWASLDSLLGGGSVITGIDINSGTIDGATIGANSANSGAFTTLSASGTFTFGGVAITASGAEINYLTGVTSNIQTQLDANASLASPTFTGTVTIPNATVTGDMSFGDNDKAIFGAGSDLQIYHNAGTSFITESGSSNFKIGGENLYLQNTAHNESYLAAIANQGVTIYYNNAAKLATTATGIDVTGTATMDGLTVDGATNSTEELARFGNNSGTQELIIEQQGSSGYAIKSSVDLRLHADYDSDTSDGGSSIEMYTDGTQRMSITGSTGDISFYEDTGTTPKFFWDASAESLGIGTTSPTEKLDVSGTVKATNYTDTVYALSGTALNASNGGIQTKTLAANTTFTDSLTSGDAIVLQLEAGASYTVTWPTMTWVTSGGNVAPTLTAKDTLVFWKVSSVLYGAYTGSYV